MSPYADFYEIMGLEMKKEPMNTVGKVSLDAGVESMPKDVTADNNAECQAKISNRNGKLYYERQRELKQRFIERVDILISEGAGELILEMQKMLFNLVQAMEEYRQLAINEYKAALGTWRHVMENPGVYETELAEAMTGIAILHAQIQREQEVEKQLSEEREIPSGLKAPLTEYDWMLAMGIKRRAQISKTVHGLQHIQTEQLEETERELSQALAIRRQLKSMPHDGYEAEFAVELETFARALKAAGRNGGARQFLQNAAADYLALFKTTGDRTCLEHWISTKTAAAMLAIAQWPWRWFAVAVVLATLVVAVFWRTLRGG